MIDDLVDTTAGQSLELDSDAACFCGTPCIMLHFFQWWNKFKDPYYAAYVKMIFGDN
jgi:hypothetical protein